MEAVGAAFNPDTMQGMMWPDSMPAEVKADLALRQQQEASQPQTAPPQQATRSAAPAKAPKPRGRLRPVDGAGKKNKEQEGEGPPPPRPRGHLRNINSGCGTA